MPVKGLQEQPGGPAWVRVLCYLFGPFGAVLFLLSRPFNRFWAVRFHAAHSMLFFAFWLSVWSILEALEELSSWFPAMVLNEIQFGFNIGGCLTWAALMFAAFRGTRLAFMGPIHAVAARIASARYGRERRRICGHRILWIKAVVHSLRFRNLQRTSAR